MLDVRRQEQVSMLTLAVTVTKFLDEHQPGFVECKMVDASGKEWTFNEKISVVITHDDLWKDSRYPQPGLLACIEVDSTPAQNPALITVDTLTPWGIESVDGISVFTVLRSQITER
jgi:hypothetical protein